MTPQKWIQPAVHIMSSFLMDHVLSQRHESPSWLRPSHRCAHTHTLSHTYTRPHMWRHACGTSARVPHLLALLRYYGPQGDFVRLGLFIEQHSAGLGASEYGRRSYGTVDEYGRRSSRGGGVWTLSQQKNEGLKTIV